MDSLELLKELVALPAPPGQEGPVRTVLQRILKQLKIPTEVDAKGNLLALIGDQKEASEIVVTAHMDEIGLMVESILPDGFLKVVPLGGLHPWKWGETPVVILAREAQIPGILSFGSIHTESDQSAAKRARDKGLAWGHAAVFTGLQEKEIKKAGIRPGTRIAMAPSQRAITEIGPYVGSYFLDDRADLVAWLLTLEKLKTTKKSILFAATVSEEIGGEGALFLLQRVRPAICVALELGPIVPESQFPLDATPTVWVRDSYACIDPRDVAILETCEAKLKTDLHWQALSRGGSDASCAASHGHCARPVTLGIPMENTHGYEIMHRDSPERLADLTLAYLQEVEL